MARPQGSCVSPPPLLIRDLPLDERPRHRLLANGSQSLSDTELLSILLRNGRPGASSLDVARGLLERHGGLAGLLGLSPEALQVPGVGPAKAATVLAAVELAQRLARASVPDRDPLSHPAAVARYLSLRHMLSDQEIMGALYLDTRNRFLAEREIFRGTLSRAAVEPRTILKHGLLRDAAGVVLFHTHPSGDPAPSAEDVAFTRRLSEAGYRVQGIPAFFVIGPDGRLLYRGSGFGPIAERNLHLLIEQFIADEGT